MARTAVGYFADQSSADGAFGDLLGLGFSRDEISIIGREEAERAHAADADEHATAGSGAALGGLTGLLVGVAAMLVPGIGPLVAVGPIAAALAGAVTGGVTGVVVGGLGGALIHAGVPEEDARYYEERFRQGGVLMTVHAPDDRSYRQAIQVLSRHGADVRDAGGAAHATAPTAVADTRPVAPAAVADTRPPVVERTLDEGPQRLELRAEQLVPHKDVREVGEVRIRTEVEEVPAQAEADVLREQLRLQHIPVNEAVNDRVAPWEEDGAFMVPVYEERLVLTKQLVLREYLRVERVPNMERRQFEEMVRRERLVVDDPDHTARILAEDGASEPRPGTRTAPPAQRSA
jgi:uncharacterized protein (TIGR02271 family)